MWGAAGSLLAGNSPAWLRVRGAGIAPAPRNRLPREDGCNQAAQSCSDFHHFQAKMQRQEWQRGGRGERGSALQILLHPSPRHRLEGGRGARAEQPEEPALLPIPRRSAGLLRQRRPRHDRMFSRTTRKGAGCNPSVFDVVEEEKQKKR